MNDVKKLVIDRSKWCRAKDPLGSALVRQGDGKMCCLGFYGCALGADPSKMRSSEPGITGHSEDGILGVAFPRPEQKLWPKWLFEQCDLSTKTKGMKLADINDETGDEQEIARIFAEHGVEVTFVDGPEQAQEQP